MFFSLHVFELFVLLPDCRAEVFVSATSRSSRYDLRRLLCVLTPPAFSTCTGIDKKCRDDKGSVEMIAQTEKELTIMACLFAS